jgi:hypothetical protein
MKKIIIWLLAIGLISGIAVYFFVFYYGAKHEDPLKSEQMVSVDAKDLMAKYELNEDTANKLYLGKVIKVSGDISDILFENNRYTINYATNGVMGTVLCEMDTLENTKVKTLIIGSKVVIAGVCNGINMDVYLDRCKLAE